MAGTWTREPLRWAGPGGEVLDVGLQDPRSLDHNEKGVWSSLVLDAPPRPWGRALRAALEVAGLPDDGLSPQGALRARALAGSDWEVDGPWLVAGADRVHLGTGALGSGAPAPDADPLPLPLPFGAPLTADRAFALLLGRAHVLRERGGVAEL
jgi:hypothetical protein